MTGATRRTVLAGVGAVGVSAAVAACGGADSPSVSEAESSEAKSPAASPTGNGSPDGVLAKASDVPVGGGVVLAEQKLVLTQPAKGDFKGFSAVCTHRGCTLANVADGTINCGCHGSKFDPEDGSVRNGPATRPLPAVPVRLEGDQIVPG